MLAQVGRSVGLALVIAAAWRTRTPGLAQRIWQADVRVQQLNVVRGKAGGPITVRLTIAADSDVAQAVRVEVMLPVGVAVLRLPAGCHASPGPVATLSARVTCALGDVPVRAPRDLTIATTAAAGAGASRLRFAAFAFSDTPDPDPSNNFAERVLP